MNSFICAAKRSPIGSFLGSLSSFSAPDLGSHALKAALAESRVDPSTIDEVYMGAVLTAGVGQAPARQAALGAGLPSRTPSTTVGKVCGSGLKAVMLADLAIRAGEAQAVLAGGMESMSQAPYLLPKIRNGLRMGPGELIDSMIKDGLWDVYNDFHMGQAAELCVRKYGLSREAQDAYAIQSYERARAAQAAKVFEAEIAPVEIAGRKGEKTLFATDEGPAKSDLSKIPSLRPVFDRDQGTITAANASTLNDGSAATLICSEAYVKQNNLKPYARIVAQSQAAQDPAWFTTAPAASIETLLRKAQVNKNEVDLWEINEAFAAVALVNLKLLEIDAAKVNVRGGAIALGHPIGASGARILVTLCHALAQTKKRYGVASLCIGGGEAVSVLVERC